MTCRFAPTGAEQQFTIPAGVTSVHFDAVGGAGGAGNSDSSFTPGGSGPGGTASGDLSVTGGAALYVEVGSAGATGTRGAGGAGGFNGGGAGGSFQGAGGGGGPSDIRTVSCGSGCPGDGTSLGSRLLVAAGGGGGGGTGSISGAGGGPGSAGVDGIIFGGTTGGGHAGGGGGGSGGAGGQPGARSCPGVAGSDGAAGVGGVGGTGPGTPTGRNDAGVAGGGGGGGGYYGGGGGASTSSNNFCGAGGGGGGSNFAAVQVSNASTGTAGSGASPSVTITYQAPPGSNPTYYVAPSGSNSRTCAQNSLSRPFTTIQRALLCAGDGDVVSLAASGSKPYPGVGTVSSNVTIQAGSGRDARSVKIDVSQPADDPSTGAPGGEMTVASSASVLVQGVTLDCVSHQCGYPNVTNHGTLLLRGDTVTGAGHASAIVDESTGSTAARLTVVDSTLAHNTNAGDGVDHTQAGGIQSFRSTDTDAFPTVAVANSTIADNTSAGQGGGIFMGGSTNPDALTLSNDTIVGNHAAGFFGGGGIYNPAGAGQSPIVAANTLIAGNTAPGQGPGSGPDCSGAITDGPGGHNLIGDRTGCTGLTDGQNGDQVGVGNAAFSPVANNGGPTDTASLQPQSPAIDAGNASTCQSAPVSNQDQRGFPRQADTRGACDVGAFDTAGGGGPARATYYVAPSGLDSRTCVQNARTRPFTTIQRALSCAADGDLISLAASGSKPYPGVGTVSTNVTIQAGFGQDARSVKIDVSAGEMTVAQSASVIVQGVTLDCVSHQCGHPNVTNHGTLVLRGDTVTGAGHASAILDGSTGSTAARLTVVDSTLAHNTNAGDGVDHTQAGGIQSFRSTETDAFPIVAVTNSTIADNTSAGQGGGILVGPSTNPNALTLTNDTIVGNHAGGSFGGGGIYNPAGAGQSPIVAANTLIAGNTAPGRGPGSGPDCSGAITDGPGGHNLIGDPTGCSGLTDGQNGDQVGVANPGLDHTLADNGGPTSTIALLSGSPAIRHGNAATCHAGPMFDRDQRFFARNASTRKVCDVGAYDTGGGAPRPVHRLIIDGLRLAGRSGPADDYVDLYNPTANAVDVGGWQLAYPGGTVSVPAGRIPAGGHFLVTGSQYSLGPYAAPDLAPAGLDLPATGGVNLIAPDATVTDAVGATTADPAYREGAGLPTPSQTTAQLGFARVYKAGLPVDTNDNAADFKLVATDANTNAHGAGAVLGAPGPRNATSPIPHNDILHSSLLDPAAPAGGAPNQSYDAATKTLTVRRTITNTSTQTVSALRFRLTDLTTYGTATAAQAILTAQSSQDATVGTKTVKGLTLQQPPNQPNGGGLGSSLSVVTPVGGLGPGQTLNVAFQFHTVRTGSTRVNYIAEAITTP